MGYILWTICGVASGIVLVLGSIKIWVKLTTGWCRSDVRLEGKIAIITGANAAFKHYFEMGYILRTNCGVASGVVLVLGSIKVWVKLTTGWCRSDVRLEGKTAIITGANAGIGYETAADFAKRGAKVILACRNTTRGTDAQERLIKATGNRNVVFKQLDLASLKSVKAFADDIKKNEERLDILVNNAGAAYHGKDMSEDGLLLPMQTNYFGHFLLTNLLLDLMKSTPDSRIVNVASIGAKWTKEFDVNKLNVYPEHNSRPDLLVYSWSKLCNILFTIELANRLQRTSVTTYSVHPGAVMTDIFRSMPKWTKILWETTISWFFKNSIEGAQTSIYCSVQKGIETLSGEHFEDCHMVTRYATAEDPELAKQLWEVSEKLVKLNEYLK